jgi:hypothetical protein
VVLLWDMFVRQRSASEYERTDDKCVDISICCWVIDDGAISFESTNKHH